jgi:hypothetical protein
MKNRKLLWRIVTFLIGIAFGLGVWKVYALMGPAPQPPACANSINVDVAHSYAQLYYNQASVPAEKIKGFKIDNCMVNTLSFMLASNSSINGFRVYMGLNANNPCWIICGLDAGGKDITSTIYTANSVTTGLCPTLCDNSSQIPGR